MDSAEGSKCLLCRSHETECVFPDTSVRSARAARARRRRLPIEPINDNDRSYHARKSLPKEPNVALDKASPEESPFSTSKTPFTDAEVESHIIGPTSSLDIRLIVEYLSRSAGGNGAPLWFTKSSQNHLIAEQQPVMFGAVQRRPLETSPSQTIASSKCEIIEIMLHPFCTNVYNLYFEKINPCLPILHGGLETLSPSLRACLLAHTMVYWRQSKIQKGQNCPKNMRLVWNNANEALYSDLYISPGMQTLSAILLNIAGRPLTCMIGNGILLASAISLAHSLGLHHDCRSAGDSVREVRYRTRVWWAIVVLDKWSSVAYGKPPQLRKTQYNVHSPGLADLVEPAENSDMSTAFPALVTLTDVLDTYLEYVFNLRGTLDYPHIIEKPDLNRKLRGWEGSLPGRLRSAMPQGDDLGIPGSPNLRLAYLYVKFLGRKLELRSDTSWRNPDASATDAISQDSHDRALRAAEDIVHFIQNLDQRDLSDFWLSPIAFTLSDTVSFLLGCAIGREHDPGGGITSCFSFQLARDMISDLQSHQTRCGWDIGAVCLAQYAKTVEQVLALDASGPASDMPHLEGGADGFTIPNLNEPLPDLWEWFEGI